MKNIILVCSAGMSTSLLVKKMQDVAKAKNIAVNITAYAEAEAKNHVSSADIILLGPQVRYLLKKIKELKDVKCPVEIIDMVAYGRIDGEKILVDALNKIK